MIEDTKLITVRNRNNGVTGYVIPERNIRREWEYNEVKKIPFGELRDFSYKPGALYALNNLLVVEDEEALEELNIQVEPEYYYNDENIKNVLLNGTIDEFADFLDFAPEGALEIAKTIAIKEEIPDTRKRDMLSEKTGLNINNAIMVNKIMDEDNDKSKEKKKERRVKVDNSDNNTEKKVRRATAPEYKVVSK